MYSGCVTADEAGAMRMCRNLSHVRLRLSDAPLWGQLLVDVLIP